MTTTLPFAVLVSLFKTPMSNQLLLPTNSSALKAHDELSAKFGHGYLSPCKTTLNDSLQNKNLSSIEGFDFVHNVHNKPHCSAKCTSINDTYSSMSALPYELINHDVCVKAFKCEMSCAESEALGTALCVNSINSANQRAPCVTTTLDIDPCSVQSPEWLKVEREARRNLKHNTDEELNGHGTRA